MEQNSSASAVSTVTCMACHVRVVGDQARRDHYRTDLHRLNLQRKVSGMPPLTKNEFDLRLQTAQAEQASNSRRREPHFCEVCTKKFSSERALQNHMASRRHRDAVRARRAAAGSMSELSLVGSDDEDVADGRQAEDEEMEIKRRIAEAVPFSAEECVFDGVNCGSAEENLRYMAKEYGFFVPYIEYLADVTGLLEYLGQKVGIGYACVECDRAFTSVSAVQQHMIDKQHCRMTSDDDVWAEEYAQFYNFPDDGSDLEDDDGWEEVDGEEAEQALQAMEQQVIVHGEEASDTSNQREYESTQEEEVALVIGTKVIGHRSMRQYYKQRGRSEDTRDAVVINKALNEYRMLGWQAKQLSKPQLKAARMAAHTRAKRNLEVGMSNYHTRKAPLRVPMAVFNSGYRP